MLHTQIIIKIMNGIIKRRDTYGSVLDPDAQAFLIATEITDATITTAINQLVIDLKGADLWDKMKAIYPIVGGTATTHKFNLKDPRDLDIAFRLGFNGGITHASTGYTPNGSTGYANTFLNPASALSLNSTHISYYSRSNTLSNAIDCGCIDTSYVEIIAMTYAFFNINRYFDQRLAPTVTRYDGLFNVNRTATNVQNVFRSGSKLQQNASLSTALPNTSIYLSGWHNLVNGALFASNRELAFASIGDGLSDSEAVDFYNAVQTFQTTLGRSV